MNHQLCHEKILSPGGRFPKTPKASDTRARNFEQYIAQVDLPDILHKFLRNKHLPKFFDNCAQHVWPVICAINWRHSVLNAFIAAELYCATSIKFVKTTYNCIFNNFSPCLYSYVCRNQIYMSIEVTYVIQPALKHMP